MRDELRIKSEEACILAAELMALTGESLEWAITAALRERFEREQARRDWHDRIMTITREIATGMRDRPANDRGRRALAG
jgi:antitoxin VapB